MKNNTIDLTHGSIVKAIILFSIPLLIGNLFQQLYNAVDSYVVGNYVGTNALAAVGASTPVINMLIGFFMGISTGAGVVIAQYFGAEDIKKMRLAIHNSMALTVVLGIALTIIGLICTNPLLQAIGVPLEVFSQASLYLAIYFWGLIFVMIYNMGSGILRSVGDSKRPLYFLIFSSVVNIVLDFLFVKGFGWGVAGAGYATLIAQAISALMVMYVLMKTNENYQLVLCEIGFKKDVLLKIIKIDGFVNLPLQAFNMAVTTFVGQNIGAKQYDRVKKGAYMTTFLAMLTIGIFVILMYLFGRNFIALFNQEKAVIDAGRLMQLVFLPFYIFLPINQVINGVLRGAGRSSVPMYVMVFSFVVLRQIYLFIVTRFTSNIGYVFFGWPVTWIVCSIIFIFYFFKVDWLPET